MLRSYPEAEPLGPCKIDYEKKIQLSKTRKERNQVLQTALWSYIGTNFYDVKDKMAELIGELVAEEKSIQFEIERMIELQENEK